MNNIDLSRFISAQERDYLTALDEIKNGKKRSHWMWYIFPQIKGLGHSSNSQYYALSNINETREYFNHPILGRRLVEICQELLKLENSDAYEILGKPDDKKLKSSMTLFAQLENSNPIFKSILIKFFNGNYDSKTLKILEKQKNNY